MNEKKQIGETPKQENTITIELKETKVQKHELKLPFYCKASKGSYFYCILNEDEAVQIEHYRVGISICYPATALAGGYEEITKEEFDKEYAKASEQLHGRLI